MRFSENKLIRFMPNHTFHNEKLSKTEQFLQECAGWLRLLDFFKQENSFLKTRLSMVVDYETDKDFLNMAEQFQNLFISKDEFLTEIIQDARMQELLLKENLLKNTLPEEKIIKKQQRLRNEIEYLEKDFTKMKNDFNKQLSNVL